VISLAELGSRLRAEGLSPRALATWSGSERVSAVPMLLGDRSPAEVTHATALLALFVGGESVAVELVPELEELFHHGLVDVGGATVTARVAILPLGSSLMVCDRMDTSDSLDIVCWPDDSSYHLALSLPRTPHARWLDLGCGSAFAALLRPELSPVITASDINERALRYAKLGCELSGVRHVTLVRADLGDGIPGELRGACNLVTCNAPIPEPGGEPYRARWRMTDTTFIERLFQQARWFVAPDGIVVVHAALDALDPVLDELTGHRVVVSYTPPGVRGFAIAWWRPDGEDRVVRTYRPLTAWRPHLTYDDRIAAMTRSPVP
jgi:SAM-dependent methyltransferase